MHPRPRQSPASFPFGPAYLGVLVRDIDPQRVEIHARAALEWNGQHGCVKPVRGGYKCGGRGKYVRRRMMGKEAGLAGKGSTRRLLPLRSVRWQAVRGALSSHIVAVLLSFVLGLGCNSYGQRGGA